ncbi:hypothetical protein MNQ98_09070 [Paenibacillus sp. N3/727]|uniref:hypothetical protein n=1 Tax=Paenibacillus sp. N3/727 TaxID=2925845 RepID=UPI001F5346DB|nr:hypothetical protein [Paenibacillus sp. N3/727]UNK20143.1 hypothetical protein MNQ98_09070 [Paenibacillus sp. N3/727]
MTRNKHSIDFKRQVVKEAIETGNKAAVAGRYEIAANMLHRWVKEFVDLAVCLRFFLRISLAFFVRMYDIKLTRRTLKVRLRNYAMHSAHVQPPRSFRYQCRITALS